LLAQTPGRRLVQRLDGFLDAQDLGGPLVEDAELPLDVLGRGLARLTTGMSPPIMQMRCQSGLVLRQSISLRCARRDRQLTSSG
jgi:hypothetical protein